MRILTNDIGGLTQDILLFDTTQTIENCVKMIMPSPTSNLARKIREATTAEKSIFFSGVNMGGGPSKKALTSHLKAGYKAYSTPEAAATFDDDITQVMNMGVEIIPENEVPEDARIIETRDIDLKAVNQALKAFEVSTHLDAIGIAVLDHGAAPPGISDRVFRFQHLYSTVKDGASLDDFAYLRNSIPPYLTRMKAVAQSLDKSLPVLVMDTPIAASIGAMQDILVSQHSHKVVVNVGNFHTLAFHLRDDTILGFFEHHTRLLNTGKLDDLIARLVKGILTNKDVFDDEGHGCLIMESVENVPFITVTGPQRRLMNNSRFKPYFAAPYGDMMLTGCFGLIKAFAQKMPHWKHEIEQALL